MNLGDSCASRPCMNNGTCQNVNGGYQCTCPSSFTGTQCETRNNIKLTCINNLSHLQVMSVHPIRVWTVLLVLPMVLVVFHVDVLRDIQVNVVKIKMVVVANLVRMVAFVLVHRMVVIPVNVVLDLKEPIVNKVCRWTYVDGILNILVFSSSWYMWCEESMYLWYLSEWSLWSSRISLFLSTWLFWKSLWKMFVIFIGSWRKIFLIDWSFFSFQYWIVWIVGKNVWMVVIVYNAHWVIMSVHAHIHTVDYVVNINVHPVRVKCVQSIHRYSIHLEHFFRRHECCRSTDYNHQFCISMFSEYLQQPWFMPTSWLWNRHPMLLFIGLVRFTMSIQ